MDYTPIIVVLVIFGVIILGFLWRIIEDVRKMKGRHKQHPPSELFDTAAEILSHPEAREVVKNIATAVMPTATAQKVATNFDLMAKAQQAKKAAAAGFTPEAYTPVSQEEARTRHVVDAALHVNTQIFARQAQILTEIDVIEKELNDSTKHFSENQIWLRKQKIEVLKAQYQKLTEQATSETG